MAGGTQSGLKGRDEVLLTGKYVVSIASSVLGFSKISGMKLHADSYSAVNEGGYDAPYFVRGPRKEMNTLTFEKGVIWDGKKDKVRQTLPALVKKAAVSDLLIMILGGDGRVQTAYSADYAVIKELSLSDLDAQSVSALIQTMTVGYDVLAPVEEKKLSELEQRLAGSGAGTKHAGGLPEEGAVPAMLDHAESQNQMAEQKKAAEEQLRSERDRMERERKESRVEL